MFRELEGAGLVSEARELRQEIRAQWEHATGWRVEPTLREFPAFEAADIWFQYPVHVMDKKDNEGHNLLADCQPMDAEATFGRKSTSTDEKKPDAGAIIENVIDEFFQDPDVESVSVQDVAKEVANRSKRGTCSNDLVLKQLRNSQKYYATKGKILKGQRP